jgi:hypothetical protein
MVVSEKIIMSAFEPTLRPFNCHILLLVIIGRNGSQVFSTFPNRTIE